MTRTRPAPVRAYTLIELLIVVALLGIASALLIPQIVDSDSLRVQAAVRQIVADLSFAQSDALAKQSFRRVHFYDDGRGYGILQADEWSDFDDPFDPGTAVYIDDPLAFGSEGGSYIVDYTVDDRFEGVSITAVDIDSGNRFVTYDALGGTVSGASTPGVGGTIDLAFNDDTFRVTVAPFTGKLTVQRTN